MGVIDLELRYHHFEARRGAHSTLPPARSASNRFVARRSPRLQVVVRVELFTARRRES